MIQMHGARIAVVAVALLGGAAACGGGKPAEAPTNDECPAGTTKKGGDCIMPDDESGPSTASTSSGSSGSSSSSGSSTSGASTKPSGGGYQPPPAGEKTAYDKESVDLVLKKAAVQGKGNCGAATDENGKALGPWGKLTVAITLARNGRIKDVAVPPPYDGKPVGKCIGLAFRNLVYPPYAAPTDVVVNWDVELVAPGAPAK